jgi:hypothetical protein
VSGWDPFGLDFERVRVPGTVDEYRTYDDSTPEGQRALAEIHRAQRVIARVFAARADEAAAKGETLLPAGPGHLLSPGDELFAVNLNHSLLEGYIGGGLAGGVYIVEATKGYMLGQGIAGNAEAVTNGIAEGGRVGPYEPPLNVGAGDNPMPGATNMDNRLTAEGNALPGVNLVGDANAMPLASGSRQNIITINPKGYDPLNPEIVRVLREGGNLTVVGQPKNPFFRRTLPALTEEELSARGLVLMERPGLPGSADPMFKFGSPKTTTGHSIDTRVYIQAIFLKKCLR